MTLRERLFLKKLRARDEKAFSELVEEHSGRVLNLATKMMSNREEAEDIAQEVFITVFKSIDKFRGDSKLSTWIYRIAINTCKNRLKYLSRREEDKKETLDGDRKEQSMGSGMFTKEVMSPLKNLEMNELKKLLDDCINELDPDSKMVLVLRDINEHTYDEIAAILDCAEGTVKSKLFRARSALRSLMARKLKEQ